MSERFPMRKVIKNTIKAVAASLSVVLLAVMALPLVLSLLASVPAVQNALVRKVAASVSESLGTKVSVKRIDVKLINRVVVDGFYVEDFHGDTLLYVPRLTAPVVEWGLGGGDLTFGRVKLERAEMWIRRDSAGSTNIREVVRAIRAGQPEKPESSFRMRILGIAADSLTFGLLRYDKPLKEGVVDFSRFVIRDTRIDIDDFAVSGDTIRMDIRSLAFVERTGWRMENLEAHDLIVSRGAVSLDNVRIVCDGADLQVPSIRITDGKRDWGTFGDFTDNISLDISMRSSRVTTTLLGRFAPAAAPLNMIFDDVSAHTRGPVASLSGAVESMHSSDSFLSLDFSTKGLPDTEKMQIEAHVHSLETTAADLDNIVRSIAGRGISEKIVAPLERVGMLGFTGTVAGNPSRFDAGGTLFSGAGWMDASVGVAIDRGVARVDGKLSFPGFDLGRALNIRDLGAVSGSFSVKGTFGRAEAEGMASGRIEGLEYRGYKYTDVSVEAALEEGVFDLGAISHDPALAFDFSGRLDNTSPVRRYSLDLDVKRADLAAMNLNRRDSISVVAGHLVASAGGTSLDDINGGAEIRGAVYVSQHGTVGTPGVTLSARSNRSGKQLTLNSEFVDAELRSRAGYRDMFARLGDFLREYIPLPDRKNGTQPRSQPEEVNPDAATDYSLLSLKTKNTERLLAALMPGTQMAGGSELSITFNPHVRSFALMAHSDFIEFGDLLATDITLNSDNRSDSLVLHLTGTDIYSGAMHIPRFALHGGAKGRRMSLSSRFAEADGNFSAVLDLLVAPDSEVEGGVGLRFGPSHISLDKKTWRIAAGSSVTYGGRGRLRVDGLRIFPAGEPSEGVTASGIVSRGASDTLHVTLNRLDLSPLGRFFGKNKFAIGGRATGDIELVSLLGNTKMNSEIELYGLSLDGMEAAPLLFTSLWDNRTERVRFQMLNLNTDDNIVRGSLSPRDGSVDAVARIESLDAGLLNPFLGNILEKTSGRADMDLTLGGTFENPLINGRIAVTRLETTVKYTRASYTLENGVIAVENSRLELPRTTVRDSYGGTADLSMRVDASNLRGVEVAIDATLDGILAFDTGPENNDAFYGRVFATGSLGIRSGRMGTRMNISAQTERGTRFHLPLNSKSNTSWSDAVTFAGRPGAEDGAAEVERKKLIYQRRILDPTPAARRKPLDIDITVGLTPDAEINLLVDPDLGKGITAAGSGVIGLEIDPVSDHFAMTGDYVISAGKFDFSMMDVFNKEFTISPGSTLRWSGSPEDAILDVEASYRVRTSLLPLVGEVNALASGRSSVPVDCILRLDGRLSEPEITFDIDFPSADPDAKLIAEGAMNTQELKSMQFLSLLMTGSFAADNSITGQSANAGVMATGAVGFDILTNQLNNFLSSDDYNIYFRYRPQDNFASNQFDVGLSTGFIDNRLLLEIEGNYIENRAATSVGTAAGTNASNLAGDVSLTWVIDRSGNLRLKVFSQTIDRLNETQGLQESGLGIYWKKDFDKFGDIFRRSAGRKADNFTTFARDSTPVEGRRKKRQDRKKNDNQKPE